MSVCKTTRSKALNSFSSRDKVQEGCILPRCCANSPPGDASGRKPKAPKGPDQSCEVLAVTWRRGEIFLTSFPGTASSFPPLWRMFSPNRTTEIFMLWINLAPRSPVTLFRTGFELLQSHIRTFAPCIT